MATNTSRERKKPKIKVRNKAAFCRLTGIKMRLRMYRTKNRSLRHLIKSLRSENAKLKKAKDRYRQGGYVLLANLRKERWYNRLVTEENLELEELKELVPRRPGHKQHVKAYVEWLDWMDPFLP